MQPSLNTLDTKGFIDYDNLSIITRPRPPRRRQTGTSIIPFRPYVKCLTSVKQPFSFTNGYDKWVVTGENKIFFTQPNARCIGSLLDDCDISDVIRWDIEGESTRLPMMCKLWMIVDGAVVERGKPNLVQDAAVQVFTSGRNLRALISSQQRYTSALTTTTTSERRRRQSWHDINEYHSVPYYQYTRTVGTEYQEGIQCDLDNEHLTSIEETLDNIEEELVYEVQIKDVKKEKVQEKIHSLSIPQNRVHVSITTQTEHRLVNQSTSTDSQLVQMYNLKLETNEILLSTIVNPYRRVLTLNEPINTISVYRNGKQYKHQSTSTGDDYPLWWLQLTTDLLLSDSVTNQTEEKEKFIPPPSPRQDQSVQTDVIEKTRQKSSSSLTSNHYEFIDDTHNSKRTIPFTDNSTKQSVSSKQSDSDYLTLNSSTNKQSHSISEYHSHHTTCPICLENETRRRTKSSESTSDHHTTCSICLANSIRIRTKSSESTAPSALLSSLLERYERTLRERQRAFTIINDELLDIDDVLKRYRAKLNNSSLVRSSTAMELYRDISLLSNQSKEEQPTSTVTNLIKGKYRSMPGVTCQEMIEGCISTPKIHLTNTYLTSPRQRQPRHLSSSVKIIKRPDYCDLCLTDHNTSSAWVRYNERRIDELQKRIDLMLKIDDNEDILLSSPIIPTTATVSQRIDDILMRRSRHHSPLYYYYHDRLLSPRRYQYRLPYRLNHSVPSSPHLLSRNVSRSRTPIQKSVRISTHSVPPRIRSSPRPLTSILRRSSVSPKPRPTPLSQSAHVWRSKVDGELHVLEPFSIPRYYRLYHDASFREMYNFSRLLDTYLVPNSSSTTDYSTVLKNYALEQQFPSPITSAA